MPLIPDPGQGETPQSSTSDPFGYGFGFIESVSATNAEDVAKTQAETLKLLDAANSGGFRISPEGVEPLKKALVNMQERLDRISAQVVPYISQTPKLGSHDYGRTVAAHDQRSGGGDTESASAVVSSLRQVIEEAWEALDRALKNYETHDEEVAQRMWPGNA